MSVVLLLTFLPPQAFAHSYHLSMTEAGLSENGDRLELGIRLFADDLEAALSAQAGRRVSLMKSAVAEPLIAAYLQAKLQVTDEAGARIPMRIVGTKQDGETVWIFVESQKSCGRNVRLTNTLLFDRFEDQMNVVKINASPVRSVTFSPRSSGAKLLTLR